MRNRLKDLLSVNSRRTVRLGRISLLLTVLAIAVLAQGCTQILDDDLGGDADIGGGIVTPPVTPSGPMAANVRVVSDPQGGSYVSELSCIIEASEIPGGGSVMFPNCLASSRRPRFLAEARIPSLSLSTGSLHAARTSQKCSYSTAGRRLSNLPTQRTGEPSL